MATIDLSADWVTDMVPRLFRFWDGTNSGLNSAGSGFLNAGVNPNAGGNRIGFLYLMKGAVPASFSELPTTNARVGDVLCKFLAGMNTPLDFSTSQVGVNPAVISTEYRNAIASGNATWFWWGTAEGAYGGIDNAASLIHSSYGTVGQIGSSSDLELPNTQIVQGEPYRVRNLRIKFPGWRTVWRG